MSGKSFKQQLIVIFIVRLLLNTGRRFIYPFAPALSRELAVPLTAVTSIIATSQFVSLLGLFSGPLADRIGNRILMRAGLLILAIGMLLCGLVPEYWFVFVGLLLASLGKTLFDPAIQSFIGRYVPYARRSRAVGFIETAWAGSTLLSIPALGVIIEHLGLRVSFFILAILAACGWLLIAWALPRDLQKGAVVEKGNGILLRIFCLFKHRAAAGMLLFGFWISLANDALFVIYGVWFENAFAVSLVTLGFSTIAIGGAELLGELSTAFFSDRVGPKRMICICMGILIAAYLLLPVIGTSLLLAMIGMFLIFFFFEIVIVTSFSLSSEIMIHSRATMLAGYYAIMGIGRVVGVFLAGTAWKLGGIAAVTASCALCTLLGLITLWVGLHRWQPEKE
ncbi:MAG: MFS transporter [Desulfobacterales bacterium]|nr:MAG: MFS transporter [Desulfobacterales bacterium]